jgi:hypothetical protein
MATKALSASSSTRQVSTTTLATTAKTSYLHFLWGTSFGVLAVLSTPAVLVAALVVACCKNTHDTLMQRWQS